MRTFKIISITLLLLILAGILLFTINQWLPKQFGFDQEAFQELYREGEEQPPVGADFYRQQLKQYEGVVKVLGVSIYGEGTHRLEKDDKLVVLLESKAVNISDFENKEARVRGLVRDTVEGGQKIMEVQFIEQLRESGATLFREVGYEFSFSYPAEWGLKKEPDKVTFLLKKGETLDPVMAVYQFEEVKESLEIWLKSRDQNLKFEETTVKVGDLTGVRRIVTDGDKKVTKTYVKEGNNAYEIRLLSQEETIRNHYFSIVDFFKTSATPEEALQPVEKVTEETAFLNISPLSSGEIARILEKGFTPFEGRNLSFDYPKVWFFSYLGDGKYGFTDKTSYEGNDQEVKEEISRVLILSGTVSVSCSYQKSTTVGTSQYTVCSREPGLEEVVDGIAGSITKK